MISDALADNSEGRFNPVPPVLPPPVASVNATPATGIGSRFANNAPLALVSPSVTTRSVSPVRVAPSFIDSNDRMSIPFVPNFIVTSLTNELGQRIIEVCVWLPSGIHLRNCSVFVTDDMKHLRFQFLMDLLMANGWSLHRDLVPGAENLIRREDRQMHVRVHHWNTVIEELKSDEGHLPRFSADIELPEEVCSKKFLRKVGKASEWGSKFMLVDLLVEDCKRPAVGEKRSFDMISKDDLDIDDDESSFGGTII